jgi:hypothetical protein
MPILLLGGPAVEEGVQGGMEGGYFVEEVGVVRDCDE